MVRPGEGGIYDNAKVFMLGRYRDRVTGIIGKVEDGHWICGRGKKEELGFGHIWHLKVPSAHPVNHSNDRGRRPRRVDLQYATCSLHVDPMRPARCLH